MTDRTEQLIRDAFAEEARRAPDSREVLAGLHRRRAPRRVGLLVATAAMVVVVAAVAAFVVPEVFRRSAPPVADQSLAVTPTSVLVVGVDKRDHTDTLGLVRLDENGALSLASLPRDLWVTTPDGKQTRLNQVYPASGADTLLSTVRDLTGVAVEHYVVMDMSAVGDLATAVGGVPVCLRTAVDDRFAEASFPAGEQVVSGPAALAFLRQRHGLPMGDLDRVARAQAFLQSLATRLRDADLTKVLPVVRDHVRTDDGLDLLGLARNLTMARSFHVGTVPVRDVQFVTPAGAAAMAVDPAEVKQFVADLPASAPVDGVPCVN